MNRWYYVGAIQGVVISCSVGAFGQPAMLASTLFQQAVTKMEAEQFTEACPLLEKSYKLDAKAGTLFTLANCRDREGKIASASARYGEYLRAYAGMNESDREKHGGRATMAEARARELQPQLPTLKLIWQGELPEEVKIRVDDVEWSGRAPELPLPLDPGTHEITVQQPGVLNTQRTVTLEIGQSTTFDVDQEVSLVKPQAPVPVPLVMPPKVDPTLRESRMNPRKLAGFITLGAGGAGLVFGGIMGAMALSERQKVDAHCGGAAGYDCDAMGFSAVEKMRSYANPSTIGFITWGILATAGVVLVLSAPTRTKEKPTAVLLNATGIRGGGVVGLKGAF